MLEFLFSVLPGLRVFVCSRRDTALAVLALRQQVAVLKRQRPRPTLTRLDRFFWTTLRHLWPRWSDVLLVVKPETVVRWHRAGFRLYWRWRSRQRGGRPRIREEIRTLIRLHEGQTREDLRHGEDDVHVADRQEFLLACGHSG
jgi:putative transposase